MPSLGGHLKRPILVIVFLLAFASVVSAQSFTRGVGVYPGDPREYHGATMVIDSTTYRNLALHRPVFQSSAYDYNLTSQLVTDGIRDTRMPRWVVSSSSEKGVLPKFEREHLVDSNPATTVDIPATNGWVQVEIAGSDSVLEVDRVDVVVHPQSADRNPN